MSFENVINLQIKAFFFNAQTDYLPYYKHFTLEINKDIKLLDVLEMIKTQNLDFSFPNKNVILKINGLVLTANESIATIVEKLGTALQIEPASTYRSNNGLILNDDDFLQSFELLAPFTTDDDLEYYRTLYPLHYASETLNYNHQYIGDAILILALKMIHNGSEHKEAILSAINDEFNGIACCEYENNLFYDNNYGEQINELKAMINFTQKRSFIDRISDLTLSKKSHKFTGDSFKNESIAFYVGDNHSQELVQETNLAIIKSGAKVVSFSKSSKLAGQTLLKTHQQLTYLKAGTMLLDALDSGADILVCANKSDFTFFQNSISKCEREVGRDIELRLISLEDFKTISIQQHQFALEHYLQYTFLGEFQLLLTNI